MLDEHGNRVVTVKKDELLVILRNNRETHRATFIKAQDGYRREVIKNLEEMLADARDGRRIRKAVMLVEPMDQTKDYDRAIKMLEMSIEDVARLDDKTFAHYVLDDWGWKEQFLSSTSGYVAR